MVLEQLGLGQAVDLLDGVAAGVVDILLIFLHPLLVLRQCDELLLGRGVEEEQVLQGVLVGAVVAVDAVFEGQAEGFVEGLVLLPVLLEHAFELALDLFGEPVGDELQLAVMLEHLAGNVEGEVLRVDQAAYKAEVIGQQVGALVHDEDAAGVKLQSLLELFGVEVKGRAGRDEEQRVVGRSALGAGMDGQQRILEVEEFFLIELVVRPPRLLTW